MAFSELGAFMAASVLNSDRAVEMSVCVARAFVQLRAVLLDHKALANACLCDIEVLGTLFAAATTALAAQSQQENTMIDLIEQHRPEVAALCSRFGVQSLEVFGSAADGAFDPAHSDIDFLVEFSEDDAGSLFHRYFGLQEALEQLFGHKIDLVTSAALRNPYFIAAVNQSRQSVYASARAQAA